MFDKSILESINNVDSLADMLRATYSIEEWDTMIHVADRLYSSIQKLYEEGQLRQGKGQSNIKTNLKRTIAYYFGFSMTAKGVALQKMGDYAAARNCIKRYAELGWIYGLDKKGQEEVAYYKMLARANTYVLDLLEGKTDTLSEYVQFIHQSEVEELLPGIITILESALVHNYNIDWVLEEFKSDLDALDGEYETDVNKRYYIDHLYYMALYFFKNGNIHHALNIAIKGLRMSDKLRDNTGFKKLNALFISFRIHATKEQQEKYDGLNKNILGRVLKDEKGILYAGGSIVSAR